MGNLRSSVVPAGAEDVNSIEPPAARVVLAWKAPIVYVEGLPTSAGAAEGLNEGADVGAKISEVAATGQLRVGGRGYVQAVPACIGGVSSPDNID